MSCRPVIIIGAPRSGTNMLRNLLVQLPRAGTWPCDEINYIWRHGNLRHSSDRFDTSHARPEVRHYLRRTFDRFAHGRGIDTLVEKTCANSLRVAFLNAVFPKARFVFIVRDGMDAVGSAVKRWHAALDLPYLMKKAIWVPWSDLPYYGARFVQNHWYRQRSKEKKLLWWGPKLPGAEELTQQWSVPELCALQWQACVDTAADELAHLDSERVLQLRYEALVQDPVSHMTRLAEFVGAPISVDEAKKITRNVKSNSVGKGRQAMACDGVDHGVETLICDTLDRFYYGK